MMNDFEKFVIYIRNSFMSNMFHSDERLSADVIVEIEKRYEINTQETIMRYAMDKFIIFTVTDTEKHAQWKFIISTATFLFGKNFKKYREQIIQDYGIQGVVTLKKQFFQHSTIPMAFIMLGKETKSTWFTSAASASELEIIIFDLQNYHRNVYYTGNINPDNLMPEFYNEAEQIDIKLDQSEIKKLYEIADVIAGKGAKQEEFASRGIQYLRARNLVDGRIEPADTFIEEKLMPKFAKQILQEGDILLSKNFGEHRLVMVTASDLPAVASNALFIIRAIDVPERYLYQYFTSETGKKVFKAQLDRIVKGATISSINLSDLKEIRVPIYDMQIMIELADIKKLESKQAMKLTEKLGKIITESQVEQMVIGQLIQAGWERNELIFNNKEYAIKLKDRKWIPDIVLLDNGEIMAIVEVKSSIFNVNRRWLEQIKETVQVKEIKMIVLTTGMFYDVYLTGTSKHARYETAPTKDELKELIELIESEVQ